MEEEEEEEEGAVGRAVLERVHLNSQCCRVAPAGGGGGMGAKGRYLR
jgi:hypothetical protein